MFWQSRLDFRKKTFTNVSRRRRSDRRKFEPLEDRRLLTTFNVTTTIDRLDPSVTLAHPFGPDGKLSLREAIELANLHVGPDTVVLKANSTYKITISGAGEDANQTGDFDISDDLTIKKTGSGANPIISGNGFDRVLDMVDNGISLTLNHVVVTGGNANIGGGLVGGDNETLTLTNSSITRNIASSNFPAEGGGIWLSSGSITATNSHIDNNSAAKGTTGVGGGIYVDSGTGDITIKNSTVNGNSAYSVAGGIDSGSSGALTVTNSQINNNHSGDGGGGGLYFSTLQAVFTNSSVSNNTTGGVGGAILTNLLSEGVVTIAKCTFNSNSAADDGGAIYGNLTAEVDITGSTFANNTSTSGGGGALSRITAVEATDTVFNHNVALDNGGAIDQKDSSGGITLLRTTFTNNVSLTGTGGAITCAVAVRSFDITDGKFAFNSALEGGGAIEANGYLLSILRSTFDHNSVGDGNGGAIDGGTDPSPITATDSTFTNNKSKADGGAFNSEGANITVTNSVISGNTATNGAGGGFNNGGATLVTITNSTISGNTAGGIGGGFFATGLTLNMTGSTVSGNRSGSEGGGAYLATNGTGSDGSNITNCTISGNGAATDGGGIHFEGDGDLTIINATIAFNSSFDGGGIAQTDGSGTIHIGNTIVAKNNAPNDPDAYNIRAPFDDLGHNLVFSDPDGVFSNGSDLFGVDPKLGPLANNGGPTKTLALSKGSPAINAGDDTLAPSTDQRGVKRPQGSHSDIGAFERKT